MGRKLVPSSASCISPDRLYNDFSCCSGHRRSWEATEMVAGIQMDIT